MEEFKSDIKAIRSDVNEIKIDISAMKVDVAHHIRRTDASERRIEKLEYVLIGLLGSFIIAATIKWLIS